MVDCVSHPVSFENMLLQTNNHINTQEPSVIIKTDVQNKPFKLSWEWHKQCWFILLFIGPKLLMQLPMLCQSCIMDLQSCTKHENRYFSQWFVPIELPAWHSHIGMSNLHSWEETCWWKIYTRMGGLITMQNVSWTSIAPEVCHLCWIYKQEILQHSRIWYLTIGFWQ